MTTNNSWNSALPVGVSDGGTGSTTLAEHGVLVGNVVNPLQVVSPPSGSIGRVLTSTGAGSAPTFQPVSGGTTMQPPTAFTPILRGSTVAGTFNYTTQDGFFMRIGNVAFVNVNIVADYTSGTNPQGSVLLQTLPIVPSLDNDVSRNFAIIRNVGSGLPQNTNATTIISDGSTIVKFQSQRLPTTLQDFPVNFINGTATVRLETTFWYTV